MKKQLAMVIDSSKCIDCKGCIIACKVQNKVPKGFSRNWIKEDRPDFSDPDWMAKSKQSHFQPGACMHCSVPSCVDACPTGATYKNPKTGAVKVDEKLCIGCSSCVSACPYDARFRNPVKNVVDKCNYCEDRRDQTLSPACVNTCPTRARVFGDIKDPSTEAGKLFIKQKMIQVTNLKSNTRPNMFYVNHTAPINWPVEIRTPTPIRIWEKAAKPVVMAATGVNALAVLTMLGRQFIDRKEKIAQQETEISENSHE